jgi:sodium transport system permease protein
MLMAAFARTFREGQSLVMPFYLLAVLPVLFLSAPGLSLTPATALLPVVNIALAARDAIGGVLEPIPLLVAAAATLAGIAILLRLVLAVLATEDVLVGSHQGGPFTFLRDRIGSGGRDLRVP